MDRDESPEDFLRLPEVMRRTGLSKSEIYRRIKSGRFPTSKRLGHRTAVWVAGEITNWKREILGMELLR